MAATADAPVAARAAAAPGAESSSPAFVRATACEAAAPIRADSPFQRRAVRANVTRKGAAPVQSPEAVPEEAEDAPMLRRAVHFCAVATSGRVYRT